MKTNPLETRSALHERLPRWTQPLLTWITGVAMPGDRPLRPWSMHAHLVGLVIAWIATMSLGVTAAAMLIDVTFGT